MKRTIALVLLFVGTTAAFAGPQFRVAGNMLTPLETLPQTAAGWNRAIRQTDAALSGWHWEVLLNRFGFGMHYGVRFYEDRLSHSPYSIDWKGDLFLSYHPMGGGARIDPFVEFGWGNAGSAAVDSARDAGYPDWEEKVYDGSATGLALYSYAAAGLALDLDGLLLGMRLACVPDHMAHPVPDPDVRYYDLPMFELGLFGGVAIGSHDRRDRRCR